MQPPNAAPLYVYIWEVATEAARSCGYALAVHGTLSRDLDLVAIPWTDEAKAPEELAAAILAATAWHFDTGEPHFLGPVDKPHGRRVWTIPYMKTWFVDLSVMPPRKGTLREIDAFLDGAQAALEADRTTVPDRFEAGLREGREQMRLEAWRAVEVEPEPEDSLRATVRATKLSISARISALPLDAPTAKGGTP